MSLGETIRKSQVWKSIFRHPMPLDRRNRIVVMLTNFFLHLHPVSIKKQGIALSYTWCMGGVTFFLFLVETVTGVLLMFYYRPTLEWAYNDILALARRDQSWASCANCTAGARTRWSSPSGCTCIACFSPAATSRRASSTGSSA